MQKIDWPKWAAIAKIASSFAIVVTLIYLAIQTQQNAEAILASSRNTLVATEVALNQQAVDNPAIRLIRSKANPTSEELAQLETWLISLVRTREHQWLQYRAGLLDESTWNAYVNALPAVLSNPVERAWWDFVKDLYFEPDFVNEVDRRLSDTPVNSDLRPPSRGLLRQRSSEDMTAVSATSGRKQSFGFGH